MSIANYPQRTVVLGFDAMDVEMVRGWAASGCLDSFQKLFSNSAWGVFQHPPEYSSGTVWSSINTGLPPHQHDFYYITRFLKESYRVRMGRPSDLKGTPYWRSLAEAGRRIVIADVPFSVPEPALGGLQFWGWGQHDWTTKRASAPGPLLRELTRRFGRHPIQSCGDYSIEIESLQQLKAGLVEGIRRRARLLISLMKREEWDFFYAAFCEAHCAGHLMWPTSSAFALNSAAPHAVAPHLLREVYQALDHALGELIAACPNDAALVVFFSHGMGPNFHADHLFPEILKRFHRRQDGEAEPPAGIVTKDKGTAAAVWQQSVGRIPETWRRWIEGRLPADFRSWLIMKRDQSPRVWARMRGFVLPLSDGHSELRVNLAGREAQGRIQAGAAYHAYLDALVAELLSLKHADTGEPAVEAVFRPDGSLDPLTFGAAPDLVIWWRKSQPFRCLQSPSLGIIAGEPVDKRPGEHIMHGMMLLSHPRAKSGVRTTEDLSVLDIAPTICGVAGVQPPLALPGIDRSRDWLVPSE